MNIRPVISTGVNSTSWDTNNSDQKQGISPPTGKEVSSEPTIYKRTFNGKYNINIIQRDGQNNWSSILNNSYQTAYNTVFYRGAMGFGITSLASIARYVIREPFQPDFFPKFDWLYKYTDKKGNKKDLRNRMLDLYGKDIGNHLLPAFRYIKETQLFNEDIAKLLEKEPTEEINANIGKVLDQKEKIKETIKSQSIEESKNYFQQNEYNKKDFLKFIQNHWSSKEIIPCHELNKDIQLGALISDLFEERLKNTKDLLLERNEISLSNKKSLDIKHKIFNRQSYYHSGLIFETLIHILESVLLGLSTLSMFLISSFSIATSYLYKAKDKNQLPKIFSKNSSRFNNFITVFKSIGPAIKRSNGIFSSFIELFGLAFGRKKLRDKIEDNTSLFAKVLKKTGSQNIKFHKVYDHKKYGYKQYKYALHNLSGKDHINRAILKHPVKVISTLGVMGLGTFGLSVIKQLWNNKTSISQSNQNI